MKKLLIGVMAAAFVFAANLPAAAAGCDDVWDDLSWWGQSEATPGPYKDAVRSGYWWWPVNPKSNVDDSELWGNRGVVYGMYTPPPPPKKEEKPVVPPPPPEPTMVLHEKTEFSDVLFDFDKSNIKPEAAAKIDKVVAEMKKYGKDTVLLEGHTCNIGTEQYNMGLGQRRADSVKSYMVEHGIDAGRIETKSYGETQPAVPNDSPSNRKLNRRVHFEITVKTKVPKQ